MEVKDLQPKAVFEIFDAITKIPRPSKKEEKIRKFILDFAKEHNIDAVADKIGNVILRKPATPGCENAPTVILQGHMDMVCESDHPGFDFENRAIETVVDGEWVRAKGTTLGADNGIGVAATLAIFTDDKLKHGPLEALITVDEETGMTGANNLEKGELKGNILINLDSEDDAEIFVGCAGGIDTVATFNYKRSFAPVDFHYFNFDVRDGLGGHSGGDIHLGRANANKIIARFIWECSQKWDITVCSISGGNLRNAIPREAEAVFGIHSDHHEELKRHLKKYIEDIKGEYEGVEPSMDLRLEACERPEYCIDSETSIALVRAIYSAPHGVISMSRDLPGLVETSTNLAAVKIIDDKTIRITTSQRSSVESRKNDIAGQVEAHFQLAGAKVSHSDGYPGWAPNMKSRIMKISAEAYEELFQVKPAIKAIHAGLECGLFLAKYPNLDMVSFGPTMTGVHSPDEQLNIPTVEKFWRHLCRVLEKVATL